MKGCEGMNGSGGSLFAGRKWLGRFFGFSPKRRSVSVVFLNEIEEIRNRNRTSLGRFLGRFLGQFLGETNKMANISTGSVRICWDNVKT